MPCFPGFCPVMNPVQDTLEMVGIDERIAAIVPCRASAPRVGITPRAIRSCASGRPTPSRPITATRDDEATLRLPGLIPVTGDTEAALRLPGLIPVTGDTEAALRLPRRSRSRRLRLDLLLCDPDDFADGGDAAADLQPAVVPERAHALPDAFVLDLVGRRALQDELPDRVTDVEQLVDAGAAAIARV